MTGLRMEIAKTTVKKIMESLQENDYFNVIAVSNIYFSWIFFLDFYEKIFFYLGAIAKRQHLSALVDIISVISKTLRIQINIQILDTRI